MDKRIDFLFQYLVFRFKFTEFFKQYSVCFFPFINNITFKRRVYLIGVVTSSH
ncbi:hypothetical protein Taro_051732 [Colocasia esculenta]|uniref:Uncharacterized protein n=1 Tax=Colocasia esculenta TaxID=4460 RepID=A0A843XGP2_COLES|nr:hypothetical protein [Colocasia esculenta]